MLGKTAFAVLAVAGAVAVTACSTGSGEKGSGTEGSEARELPPFSAVEVSGQADAVVRIGEPRKVTVRGDDNLLEQVKTEVSGDTLEVSQDEDIDPDLGITVEIRIPRLDMAELSGGRRPDGAWHQGRAVPSRGQRRGERRSRRARPQRRGRGLVGEVRPR